MQALQRSVPLHRKFRALDHGRGHPEFKGRPSFTAYSAGSHPSGAVRPEAIAQLESARLPTDGLEAELGRIRQARRAPNSISFSPSATTPRKKLSDLARPAPHRSLGGSRPAAIKGTAAGNRTRLPRSLHDSRTPNQPVSQFASGQHRQLALKEKK